MLRQLKTAEEIRDGVSERLHATRRVVDDGETITVPMPTRRPPGSEEGGCNWTMLTFGNGANYQAEISEAVRFFMQRWNLGN